MNYPGSEPIEIVPLENKPDLTIAIPGSKSHTNRALICAAMADGRSGLEGALFADDTEALLSALLTLGLRVYADSANSTVTVFGCAGKVPEGPAEVDVRMSGTTSRFVIPMLALGPGPYRVDGHPALRDRPFEDLTVALRELGATIDSDSLPMEITGRGLKGGKVSVPGSVSSQFLSGLLLSAPYMRGGLVVEVTGSLVSKPYIDLTIATMAQFGVAVKNHEYVRFEVSPGEYSASRVPIEPDASAASYFFAAAAITGGRVRVNGLGTNTVQGDLAFVDILEEMGAEVVRGADYTEVAGTGSLQGVKVDMANVSDTAQTLAIVATFASSPTVIDGIGFIRRKETDRIGAVVTELTLLGISATENDDGMTIYPGVPQPGMVQTYDDHRMAMSFALLGLKHPGITIENPNCVAKTFPNFFETLEMLAR